MNNEIETYHNLITIDQEKMMTSLELAKVFGQRHADVLRRLESIIEDDGFFELGVHHTPRDYKDSRGKMRPMLEINFDIALAYAAKSRKRISTEFMTHLSTSEGSLSERCASFIPSMPEKAYADAGVVYVIKCEQFYKIGKTVDMKSRLATHQGGNPFPLHVISVTPTLTMSKCESDLHQIFKEHNVRGEWFELSMEQVESIPGLINKD